MAPSYMYVYPHICNHFSWLRAWCWFRLKVNKRGQVQIIYGTGWTLHWIFFHSAVILCTDIFWETACLHSLPPNFGWTSLGKKEPTFHMRWLCLFVFLLRLLYGWITFQAPKRSPHMCLLAKVHQPKLSPLFAPAPRALMVGPIPEHSFWPEHNIHQQLLQVRDLWI